MFCMFLHFPHNFEFVTLSSQQFLKSAKYGPLPENYSVGDKNRVSVSAPRAQSNSMTFPWPNHVNPWLNNLKIRTKYGKNGLVGRYTFYVLW